jgi:AraC-like DNA-binding protein
MPLAELAERVGYQSEASFSRAFEKTVGVYQDVSAAALP